MGRTACCGGVGLDEATVVALGYRSLAAASLVTATLGPSSPHDDSVASERGRARDEALLEGRPAPRLAA